MVILWAKQYTDFFLVGRYLSPDCTQSFCQLAPEEKVSIPSMVAHWHSQAGLAINSQKHFIPRYWQHLAKIWMSQKQHWPGLIKTPTLPDMWPSKQLLPQPNMAGGPSAGFTFVDPTGCGG